MAEMFDVVDEDDNIIGKAPREQCHKNPKLIHRSAGVLLFNSKGEFLIQKRSMKKDTNPGTWTISAWGHLDIGESYEHAAAREMKEELGASADLKFAWKAVFRASYETEIYVAFIAISDGPFKTDPDEVSGLEFISIDKLKKQLREKPERFNNACIHVLNEYFKRYNGGIKHD
jgi:isopentenyl-diphosphate delta-isomerase type 1